jgi:hypothetical protein
MPQIPLYKSQATPTTSRPISQVSAEPAVAIGRAVSQAGKMIGDIGQKIHERKVELKQKADLSDYNVMIRNFNSNLDRKKHEALMAGESYTNIYDKVIAPEMNKFEEQIGKRNYSKQSMGSETIQSNQWA